MTRSTRTSIVLLSTLVMVGCQTQPAQELPADAQKVYPEQFDLGRKVDCRLPGQIRDLGKAFTYLEPGRRIETSAGDCQIRGGEYVAFDRADYRTALEVLKKDAEAGDPRAQTFVGDIYRKGLGVEADYQQAREWYRKAAQQGYARAQINLGSLYEKGLGVEKSPVQALNWYRKASGLKGEDLRWASTAQIKPAMLGDVQTEALRKEIARREQADQNLRKQLSETDGQTRAEPQESDTRLPQASQRRQELGAKLARRMREVEAMRAQLSDSERELAATQSGTDASQQQASAEQDSESIEFGALESDAQQRRQGPTIGVFDPRETLEHSGRPNDVSPKPQAGRDIAGRVKAPAGLSSLTVNGRPAATDEDGEFRVSIPPQELNEPVHVVAVDELGQRGSVNFTLVPRERVSMRLR